MISDPTTTGDLARTVGLRAVNAQRIGGRPYRVIRHTVRHLIGRRGPHGVRTPSLKPPHHALRPVRDRIRAMERKIHTPRYTGIKRTGSRRRASQTRFRAVNR
jgi:hypothetical protein